MKNENTIFITGINGQTGSYLAELMLNKGYEVYGIVRRSSVFTSERIDHIFDKLNLKFGDLSDANSINDVVNEIKPKIFVNLAAQSHVRVSFDIPIYTADIVGLGVLRCLEAIRKYSPNTRFVQASSSEMFGSSPPPQNENTPFHPRSPYAVSKVSGHNFTVNYRESYGLFCSNLISFNHESSRRGETFVTKKITRAATRIKMGLQDKLYLGNLSAKRDWSHAKDVAEAIYLVSTADEPDDYVVASGENYSVEYFLDKVFSKLDMNWKDYVEFNKRYLRPAEVDNLLGDPTKIKEQLNWEPKYSFEDLVDEMIENDLILAKSEKLIKTFKNNKEV